MPAGPTHSRLRQATACREMPVLRLRELFQDCFVQTNAALEIFERKILVRRMGAAIGERKSYEQRFDAKNFAELGNDRYAPALAYQGSILSLERQPDVPAAHPRRVIDVPARDAGRSA